MTPGARGEQVPPSLVVRAVLMLLAAALVSTLGLGVVDATTRPVVVGPEASGRREAGAGQRRRDPEIGRGLGELGIQVLLVGGTAFAGRRILKIRL